MIIIMFILSASKLPTLSFEPLFRLGRWILDSLECKNQFVENFDRKNCRTKNLTVPMESREQGLSIEGNEIEYSTKSDCPCLAFMKIVDNPSYTPEKDFKRKHK